jgi:hypothetical protein
VLCSYLSLESAGYSVFKAEYQMVSLVSICCSNLSILQRNLASMAASAVLISFAIDFGLKALSLLLVFTLCLQLFLVVGGNHNFLYAVSPKCSL